VFLEVHMCKSNFSNPVINWLFKTSNLTTDLEKLYCVLMCIWKVEGFEKEHICTYIAILAHVPNSIKVLCRSKH